MKRPLNLTAKALMDLRTEIKKQKRDQRKEVLEIILQKNTEEIKKLNAL